MKRENYKERLRNFLDEDTAEAKISSVLLCVLAVISIPFLVFAAAALGNAVQIVRIFKGTQHYSKAQIISAMQSLKRQRLIEYVCDKNGKTLVRITKKGEIKLKAFDIELMKIKKPKKWDKKWRLVMFDIPIRFKKGREALRYHLKDLGFYQFQKSAWIYPYPCEDEILYISDFYGIGRYVDILTIDYLSRDVILQEYFSL